MHKRNDLGYKMVATTPTTQLPIVIYAGLHSWNQDRLNMSSHTLKDGELQQALHVEAATTANDIEESDRRPEAQGKDQNQLPAGYFYSPYFTGSYCVCICRSPSRICALWSDLSLNRP